MNMVSPTKRGVSGGSGTDSTGKVPQEAPLQFGEIHGQLYNPGALPVVILFIDNAV